MRRLPVGVGVDAGLCADCLGCDGWAGDAEFSRTNCAESGEHATTTASETLSKDGTFIMRGLELAAFALAIPSGG